MPLPGSLPTGRSRALRRTCWNAGGLRRPEAPTAQSRSTGSCFGAVGTAVGLVDTLGKWFSGRVCGRVVDHLVLDRGELAEGALAAAAAVGPFDPGHDRQAQLVAGGPALAVQDVLLQQGEVGLHGGVVPGRPDPAHGSDQAVDGQGPDVLP